MTVLPTLAGLTSPLLKPIPQPKLPVIMVLLNLPGAPVPYWTAYLIIIFTAVVSGVVLHVGESANSDGTHIGVKLQTTPPSRLVLLKLWECSFFIVYLSVQGHHWDLSS